MDGLTRCFTVSIVLYGEDGAGDEFDCKNVQAREIGEATEMTRDWAAETREQTGEPWQFLSVMDDDCGYFDDNDDWTELKEENILDADLPAAQDTMQEMSLQQLCYHATEIMTNELPEQHREQVEDYVRDLNIEIVKRVAFWAAVMLLTAYCLAMGSGVLFQHLAGGIVEMSSLHRVQGVFGAGAIIAWLVACNKKMIALERWAKAWASKRKKVRRE